MPNGIFTLKQQVDGLRQGAWTNQKTPFVNYLVVAGGGGGGDQGGGGGGGGGLLQGVINVTAGSAITATVGAGGVSAFPATNGANSVFGVITSTGGGGGGHAGAPATAGLPGGSGGGSASYDAVVRVGAQGIAGQGNKGGDGVDLGLNQFSSAGGGGAGTAGLRPVAFVGGNGGAGIASDISGTRTAYAGGGAGGGNSYPSNYGNGGAGGGGGASTSQNGAANTGGGGSRGTGGSGVVIISYPDTYLAPTATTGSPTVSTSGSGSIAFSGTLQSLSTPSNAGLSFGTGDFTVEAWVYANSVAGERGFFQTSDVASGFNTSYTTGVILVLGSPTTSINCNIGGTNISSGATTISTGIWYHVAVTRASGSVRLFINGALVGGPTTVTANLTGTFAAIGGYFNNNFLWNGNVSNLRVVKGTAVYTSAFTPSTAPLTAISGTSLLMNTVSGAQLVDGSSNSLTLTPISGSTAPIWNQLSPFATGLGFKNRVYTWTSSGSITF